jgi:hypothetical protein
MNQSITVSSKNNQINQSKPDWMVRISVWCMEYLILFVEQVRKKPTEEELKKMEQKKILDKPYSWQAKMASAAAILEEIKSGSSSDDDEQDKRAKAKSAKMDDDDAPWKPSHRRHRRQQQPPPAEMDTTGDQKETPPSSFLSALAEMNKQQKQQKKCHADFCKLPCNPPESPFCGNEKHKFPQDKHGNRWCAVKGCCGTSFSHAEALCPQHTPKEPRQAAAAATAEIKNKKQPEPEDVMAWISEDDLEPLPQLKNVNTVDITRFKHKKTGEIYYHAAGVATVFFEPNEGRKSADARLIVRKLKDKGRGLYTHIGNSRIVYLTARGLQIVLPLLDAKDEIVAAFAQEPMTTTTQEEEEDKNQKKRKRDEDDKQALPLSVNQDTVQDQSPPEKKAKTGNGEEDKKEKKQVRWQCMHQAGCTQESREGTALCDQHTPKPVEALFQDSQVQVMHIESSTIPLAVLSESPQVVSAAPAVKDAFPGFISAVIPHEFKKDAEEYSTGSGVVLMEDGDDDFGVIVKTKKLKANNNSNKPRVVLMEEEDEKKKEKDKEEYKPLFKPSIFGEVFRCLDETVRCQTPEYKKSGRCEYHYKKLNGLPVEKKNRSGEGTHTWFPCHYERCNGSANNIASGLRYCSEAHKNRKDGLGIHYCVEQGCKEQAFKNDGKYCSKHHPNRCNYDNDCREVLEGTGAGFCDVHLKLFQKQQEDIRAAKKKKEVIVIPEERKLTRAVEHDDPKTGKIQEPTKHGFVAPQQQRHENKNETLSRLQKELERFKVRDEYLKMLGWMKNNVPLLAMAPAHATAFTVCIQNLQANVFNLSGKSL